MIPEYTLTYVSVPTKGSFKILNATAVEGSLSLDVLLISLELSSGSDQIISHLSNGEGR